MSRSNRSRNWLPASAILGITLTLTASNFRIDAPAASIHLARTVTAKPRTAASLPPHLEVASGYPRHRYIVQADTADAARDAVLRAGGVVNGDLSVIRAVAAALDEREINALRSEQNSGLHIYNDSAVVASSLGTLPETYYPSEVDAANLHVGGMTGRGVTVAVIDSGLWNQQGPLQSAPGTSNSRVLAQYDVIQARQNPRYYLSPLLESYSRNINDTYGHGTHVTSVIASSGVATT
ncbi:MAG TPA: hypothetical protein VK652_15845, partial [Steroidobacteraceae bacterium]|nr:hypothetical protein [Steroidobacteraceae bacterium]